MSEMGSPPPSPPAGFSSVLPNLSSYYSASSDTEVVVNHGSDRRFNHRFAGCFNQVRLFFWEIYCLFKALGELSMSCVGLVLTIWVFVATAMLACVYGPQNVWIGPSTSMLVEPSAIFVQGLKVKELYDSKSELQLFGFDKSPPLNVPMNWTESRLLSVSRKSSKGWTLYLNEGTSMNISYSVKPEGSLAYLVVNEGSKGIHERYLEEHEKTALSWNMIHGSGKIEVKISKSSWYYVDLANPNLKDIKVELDIDVKAVVYDTKQSFYKCTFTNSECSFNEMTLFGNSFVLTSPPPRQGASAEEEEWYIRFTYQPRYISYVIVTGLLCCCTVGVVQVLNGLLFLCEWIYRNRNDTTSSTTTLLLVNKDDDESSIGSSSRRSYDADADTDDSTSNDREARKKLCVICFDAPKDSFFLPCGHCASCYECGTKIAKGAKKCPICRRKMKRVKRIFSA